ncbi:hypothetical protein RvY_11253 [Ramazzottius varieornatus]|uniref:Uncharacterized protein n=1 Tax=Ramazzottius varieornatus TaxID=947166 RepID=A0A1D1VHK6_RAMVA|nr:hypothetical protein RvY_11253 [Ramazzottius varieornatus]
MRPQALLPFFELSVVLSGLTVASAVHIRLIMMVIGGAGVGRVHMDYQIAGSAYDTAIEHSMKLYPRVCQNLSLTRHFVPGLLSCPDAAAEAATSLASLYADKQFSSSMSAQREFQVMFARGRY